MFRIDKVSLTRLYIQLLFESENRLPYGHVMSGEDIFLRGLYELSTGSLQQMITRDFGGYQPHQSMAFTFFVDHIFDNFSDLVTNNLEWWFLRGWMQKSRDAITRKMATKYDCYFDVPPQRVCSFIDCNALECSRVLHGPAMPGEDSLRWDVANDGMK